MNGVQILGASLFPGVLNAGLESAIGATPSVPSNPSDAFLSAPTQTLENPTPPLTASLWRPASAFHWDASRLLKLVRPEEPERQAEVLHRFLERFRSDPFRLMVRDLAHFSALIHRNF